MRTKHDDRTETENAFRMTPEEIEAWMAEGEALTASFRERVEAKRRERKEEAAA